MIDADGHIVEPGSAWSEVPEGHRPVITKDAHGYEHVIVAGKEILAVPLGTLATPGSNFANHKSFKSLEEALPGGSDPKSRLVDMDLEGIDQAVLFPSIGLYFSAIDDPQAASVLATAYNDWLADYCNADPTRLFGAAMVPMQDPKAAVAELERAAGTLGFTAAFVRPNPCLGRSLSDPAYERLWTAAQDLDITIGIHEGSSVIVPTLGSDRPFNPLILHAVSHPFEEMLACAQLIAFGVLERHPKLRFVFLESNGGWAPFWLERLDEQAETFGDFCPEMRLRPSEYFERQCTISYEIDEPTLPALADYIGPSRIVWGSDYPHHDATFPGAVETLRRTMSPLPVDVQARILGENARDLYRLPARRGGPAGIVDAYFRAITLRDGSAIAELFAPHAELHTGGILASISEGSVKESSECIVGADAIREFYERGAFTFDDLLPHPGSFEVTETRVEVPIDLRIAGSHRTVHDIFEVVDDRIQRLDILTLPG